MSAGIAAAQRHGMNDITKTICGMVSAAFLFAAAASAGTSEITISHDESVAAQFANFQFELRAEVQPAATR
jgi:hypothetical protein